MRFDVHDYTNSGFDAMKMKLGQPQAANAPAATVPRRMAVMFKP